MSDSKGAKDRMAGSARMVKESMVKGVKVGGVTSNARSTTAMTAEIVATSADIMIHTRIVLTDGL